MSKKVALVSHEMSYTGAPRSLLEMAKILRECGYKIQVCTLSEGAFIKQFEKEGFTVHKIDFAEDASEELAEKLKKYDLVIANTIFTSAFACYAQRFCTTILYVREAHNIPELIADCGLNEADLSNIKHMVCVSEYAEAFINHVYHPAELCVIHNFAEDKYGQTGRRIGKQDKKCFHLLVLGTVEPRKGQKIAIDACERLPENLQKYMKLHLAGAVPKWAEEYWSGIKKRLCDRIIYHGEIQESNELQKLYESMDIVIVPSMDESCSLVTLEAAMYGKALIVTENVGANYFVDADCIVKTNDSIALSRKIEELITTPQVLPELGRRNRERYLEYGTREQYQNNLLTYIDKLEKQNVCRMIKVSIVVPVYNVACYLRQCMDSLVKQTLQEIEIICVNDGSTDSSVSILEEYQAHDARIWIISTANLGYGHAVNTGMAAANGEYVGIVEPDDYVDERMYEILYHRAIATDTEIVKGDFYRFYGCGEEQKNIYHSTAREAGNYNRVICPRKEKECFRFIMNTWSGIYRRTFLERYGICHHESPGASYQDNGFWFQGLCQAKRIYFVNRPLYYNRRDNPESSVNDRKKVYCANEEYAWIRKFLETKPELESEFLYQYSMKKYHTYMFTLERIAWEYKKEYLETIAKEFKEAEQRGELSKAAFTSQEWEYLHWIIRDAEDYYEKVVKGSVKISVIIPVYNAAKYLYQCLESLENQNFTQIEVICIDDGSTDNSKKILDSFAGRDKRFCVYYQENAGAGAARNRGLRMAHGEYIIFLDADDYFSPEMLLHAWQRIRETESDICLMGSWQHDMETERITPCTYSVQADHYPKWRPFRVSEMQFNPFRCFVGWAWDKLYRRSFLLNHNLQFQEQRTSNDMYFTYMSLFKADKITTLDERVIYQRRNLPESLSATRAKSWWCFYDALMAMRRELEEMGVFERNRIYFENYALHSCLWNLETLPEEAAKKLLAELLGGWFVILGISELKEKEFEYREEYERLILLKERKVEGLQCIRENYQKQKAAQKEKMRKTDEGMQSSEIKNGGHAKRREDFGSEAEYYGYCLEEIRKSKSYKIGMAVTWLPRIIRGW